MVILVLEKSKCTVMNWVDEVVRSLPVRQVNSEIINDVKSPLMDF